MAEAQRAARDIIDYLDREDLRGPPFDEIRRQAEGVLNP